jgi:NADH-quinone oxidoreductase chain I
MKMLREALKSLVKSAETIRYPAKPSLPPEGFRGKHVIHFERCVGCGLCVRVCPASAIRVKAKKRQIKVGKIIHQRIIYGISSIDISKCVFCQRCEEICPTKAIELTQEFDMASDKPEDLKVGKGWTRL